MGLSFDTPTQKTESPAYGQLLIDRLDKLLDLAGSETDARLREDLYDCINNRYRSTAFRDMIKSLPPEKMSMEQRQAMKNRLDGIRFRTRTPRVKAWRYQWP